MLLGLIMARMIPVLTLNPFLGGHVLPQNAKTGLALLVTILVYKPVSASLASPLPLDTLPYSALLIKEIVFGTVLGYVSSLVFYAIQSAGRIMDFARGSSMASMLAPQTEGQVSPLGELQFQLAIVLFLLLNGHTVFLHALFRSFEIMPLTGFPSFLRLHESVIYLVAWLSGQVLHIALLLAAPVVIATFMADMIFGIINRVAPQINVFFLSMPVKLLAGLTVMLFILGFLTGQMQLHFAGMLRSVQRAIQIFAGGI